MVDSTMKYFVAISENKRKDIELKSASLRIEGEQKKMLTRYWKDKIDVFDDMIRLNVRTPTYSGRTSPGEDNKEENNGRINLGHMKVDAKLMSNKPMSLQRGKKGASAGIEPVICIEGSDAVCYPNKEARKGRKVALSLGVLRRMEQCKALTESIDSIHSSVDRDQGTPSPYHWRSGALGQRPFTAPGRMRAKSGQKRGVKSAGVRPEATALVGPSVENDSDDRLQDNRKNNVRRPASGEKGLGGSNVGSSSLTMATAKRLTSVGSVSTEKRLSPPSSVSASRRLASTSSASGVVK